MQSILQCVSYIWRYNLVEKSAEIVGTCLLLRSIYSGQYYLKYFSVSLNDFPFKSRIWSLKRPLGSFLFRPRTLTLWSLFVWQLHVLFCPVIIIIILTCMFTALFRVGKWIAISHFLSWSPLKVEAQYFIWGFDPRQQVRDEGGEVKQGRDRGCVRMFVQLVATMSVFLIL